MVAPVPARPDARDAVVDGRFVPALAPHVAAVVVGDEGILLEEPTALFHLMNAAAMLLLDCCDGRTPLGRAAAEVAEASGAPFEQVLADGIQLVSRLYGGGVVVDARVPGAQESPVTAPPDPAALPSPSLVEARLAGAPAITVGADRGPRVTIRTDDPAFLATLAGIFRPIQLEGLGGAATVSVVIGGDPGAPGELHHVYCGRVEVSRTPSLRRVMESTLGQVARLLEPAERLLRLECETLLDAEGRAVLIDDRQAVWRVGERRLADLGLRRLDLAGAPIDPDTNELVVSDIRLVVDEEALGRFRASFTYASHEQPVSPGRHRVRGLCLLGGKPDHLKLTSSARRLGSLVPLVTRADGSARAEDLAAVGHLAESCEVVRALGGDADDVVAALERFAE